MYPIGLGRARIKTLVAIRTACRRHGLGGRMSVGQPAGLWCYGAAHEEGDYRSPPQAASNTYTLQCTFRAVKAVLTKNHTPPSPPTKTHTHQNNRASQSPP
jgi:hypothetical protein